MNSGAPTYRVEIGTPGDKLAPLLKFYIPTIFIDWLFLGVLCNPLISVASANFASGFPGGVGTVVSEGLGTSRLILDNSANTTTHSQAARIYFIVLREDAAYNSKADGTQTCGCAIKLRQRDLQ